MDDFLLDYARQAHKTFEKYYSNVIMEVPIALGNVGILEKDVYYEHRAPAKRFGFDQLATVQGKASKNSYFYATQGQSNYRFLGKGEAGLANGGVEVELSGDNAFFINLAGVTAELIDDRIELENQIVELFRAGSWKKEYVVITEILQSQSIIILGSRSGSKRITIEAKAPVQPLDLANAAIGFTAGSGQQSEMQVITENQVPLFKVARLKSNFWGKLSMGLAESEEPGLDEIRERLLESDAGFRKHFSLEYF